MKKKLNLDKLKVESFVTNVTSETVDTVLGGRPPKPSYNGNCPVEVPDDPIRLTDRCSWGHVCNTGHLCYISINATC